MDSVSKPALRDTLLGRDYWMSVATPAAQVTAAQIDAVVDEHLLWLLGLERDGVVFLSGPLVSGEGVGPGSGVTVLRAESEEEARAIAETDPFVRAGLRTFQVYGWRLNEGAIDVRLRLGVGTVDWR